MFSTWKQRINLDFLQALKGALTLVRDPSQTLSVYDIEDSLRRSKAMQLAIDHVLAQPGVTALFQERYLAPAPDLEALAQLPPGSLGHIYATYIQEHGFDPGFYRPTDTQDDAGYFLLRLRQTHDIWHLVTGFDIDVPGELGLKAFELAQTRRTVSGVLLAGGLLRCLFQSPEDLDLLLDRIAVGYRLGARARPLLAQKWEDHWERSMADWRAELNIQPMERYIPA